MIIHSPIFSGSISQANSAYASLSGSFTGSMTGSFRGTAALSGSMTGSFTGSFKGEIDVQQATFDNLIVRETLTLGNSGDDIQRITGSIQASGSMIFTGSMNLTQGGYLVDGVNVLDSAIAFAIALG